MSNFCDMPLKEAFVFWVLLLEVDLHKPARVEAKLIGVEQNYARVHDILKTMESHFKHFLSFRKNYIVTPVALGQLSSDFLVVVNVHSSHVLPDRCSWGTWLDPHSPGRPPTSGQTTSHPAEGAHGTCSCTPLG